MSFSTQFDRVKKQSPVVDFFIRTVSEAIAKGASDLFLESQENGLVMRYRRFGQIYPFGEALQLSLSSNLIAHVKGLASLSVSNTKSAQDGRINFDYKDRPIDIRLATTPTQFGENLTLRILDRETRLLNLDDLGISGSVLVDIRKQLHSPKGLIIVTGATGAGKTTTLYSMLEELNSIHKKILTAEDPIEYMLPGIIQVPVQRKLSYIECLRAFLRQDPDVIMVGEIRDRQTAEMAVQAALTGHLVLSTLHTPDASSAIARLIDLGLEPSLIASALQGVLAQSLTERVCSGCDSGAGVCRVCYGTKIEALEGHFEWVRVGASLRELINLKASVAQIRSHVLGNKG